MPVSSKYRQEGIEDRSGVGVFPLCPQPFTQLYYVFEITADLGSLEQNNIQRPFRAEGQGLPGWRHLCDTHYGRVRSGSDRGELQSKPNNNTCFRGDSVLCSQFVPDIDADDPEDRAHVQIRAKDRTRRPMQRRRWCSESIK